VSTIDRRAFLKTAAAGTGGLALAGPLQAFAASAAGAATADGRGRGHGHGGGRPNRDYGPISPVADHTTGQEMLALPAGFEYWSLGDVGTTMADGIATPPAHDGMAAYRWRNKIRIVRNHEVRGRAPAFGGGADAYDPQAGGGNTIIEFDPRRPSRSRSWGVLAGTSTNCAGGATTWQSWLTCEETTETLDKPHGYVFDVPVSAEGFQPATPIVSMGRFSHEAVAVEPGTNIVYLTEDAGGSSGFYRHVPRWSRRPLSDARLQMLKVVGVDNAEMGVGQTAGTRVEIEWVDIDQPDPDIAGGQTVFGQGAARGGAAFRRLEGAWWSEADRAIYFNSTDGGAAGSGQVWAWYRERRREYIELVYESPSSDVLLKPDNLTISPRGGVLLCEDPDRARQSFLRGITGDGELYDFAANVRPGTIPGSTTPRSWDEFAGATFCGEWMFVNIQTPGVTLAITGPWRNGPLG
jgi:uncharacterized protein